MNVHLWPLETSHFNVFVFGVSSSLLNLSFNKKEMEEVFPLATSLEMVLFVCHHIFIHIAILQLIITLASIVTYFAG